jgi:hypothetical protein
MKETHIQQCPLCLGEAQYRFVDADNRKYFRCPSCTEFQISVRAEERLASTPQWRSDYAEMSRKHPNGFTLTVLLPTGPKEPGVAIPALVGEYVKDDDLPRR